MVEGARWVRAGIRNWTLVDSGEYERVTRYRVSYAQNGYAYVYYGPPGHRSYVLLHRFICDVGPDLEVDHRNGDRLDNRRANLRATTRYGNAQNAMQPLSATGFRGVNSNGLGYEAAIRANNVVTRLGNFPTPEAAARAYDDAARALHGEFAIVNFPREGERSVPHNCPRSKRGRKTPPLAA